MLDTFRDAGKEGLGVVFRVPVLYGPAHSNAESAVNVLMDAVLKVQRGEGVVMDAWSLRYPTNTEDVGRVLQGGLFGGGGGVILGYGLTKTDVAVRYLEEKDRAKLPRVLQFSAEDKYTKYEICQLFAEIMGINIDKMEANKEGNDPNASVQRPYDCHLSTKALQSIGIDVSTQSFPGWWKRECKAFRH